MKQVDRDPVDIPVAPDAASALGTAALVALHAPSVHNTQPWHWRVTGDRLELYGDQRWRLDVADPSGRLLLLSCGAALHHARVALRGMGYLPAVRRFRDRDEPGLLATVTVDRQIAVTGPAAALLGAILARQTDRRPFADVPLPESAVTALRQAAASEGAWLHLLSAEQATTLLAAAEQAETVEFADRHYRQELASWTRRELGASEGIPATALPPRGDGYPRSGSYAVLYGNGDRPISWLHAGEALSAVWLAALVNGLCLQPLSVVIEVPAARATLHRMLYGMGSPYLALRIGIPAANGGNPTLTGRRPAPDSVDVAVVVGPGSP
ncbi:MAG: nitroreductase [Micromonosporaceae bacterium]